MILLTSQISFIKQYHHVYHAPHAIARNIQYLNLTNKSKCAMYEALIRISQACPAMYKYTFTTIDIYDVIFLRSCHDTNDDLSI